MSTDADNTREAFEAWSDSLSAPAILYENGDYHEEAFWRAWKDSAEAERARILALLPVAGYVDAAQLRKAISGE